MNLIFENLEIWLGIAFCISQSAMFSGLNLAFFSVTRLRLEVEVAAGDKKAERVLGKRKDSNYLLTTILWGNVGINVLLTLLSDSILTGVGAFFFSTVVITLIGEIIPQAYFSRYALRMAYLLSPVLSIYQILLYPVAKPVALLLDFLLGKEGIQYFREHNLREVIKKHIEASESDIDRLEGMGALNFLEIDDLIISEEGVSADPKSVIKLPVKNNLPHFPSFEQHPQDPFLRQIHASGKKWVIFIDEDNQPRLVLDADGFLRSALFESEKVNIYTYCHRPLVVRDLNLPLGKVLMQLKAQFHQELDDIIDRDLILIWGDQKKVITGADILGRLLRGITPQTIQQ